MSKIRVNRSTGDAWPPNMARALWALGPAIKAAENQMAENMHGREAAATDNERIGRERRANDAFERKRTLEWMREQVFRLVDVEQVGLDAPLSLRRGDAGYD